MHRRDRVPILVAHLVDQVVAGDPRIVDQDVERAETLGDLADRLFNLDGGRDIELEADSLDAMPGADARRSYFGTGAVEIADRDRGAVLGQALGRRLADAAGAAGHQRDASFRAFNHVLPFSFCAGQPVAGYRVMQPAYTAIHPPSTL